MGKTRKRVSKILGQLVVLSCSGTVAMDLSLTPDKITTFAQVKKILSLSRELAARAEQTTTGLHLPPPGECYIDPSRDQLQQGLSLFTTYYPRCLASPWGNITLYEKPSAENATDFIQITRELFKRIQATLVSENKKLLFKKKDDPEAPWTPTLLIDDTFYQAEAEPTDDSRPCDERPHYLWCYPVARYAITAVEGHSSPTPQDLLTDDFRPHEAIVAEWNLLEARYQEQQPNNHRQDLETNLCECVS